MNSHALVVNVEVAVVRDGRYLAIVRGQGESFGAGWLTFPGGKLEIDAAIGQALESTARREVREEVGLTLAEPVIYVESHIFEIRNDDIVEPVLDVVMLARADAGEASCVAEDEVAEAIWLTFAEFCADPRTQEWTRQSLRQAEAVRSCLGW